MQDLHGNHSAVSISLWREVREAFCSYARGKISTKRMDTSTWRGCEEFKGRQ